MHFQGPVLIFPFISYPDLPRLPRPTSYLQNQGKAPWGRGCSTARVGSGHKIETDPTEFYGVGLDWILSSSWRKRTCFHFHVYTCVTGKVQISTSFPEASRPHSVSEARIFSSFQLLSIVLTYKLNWLFSFFSACPGLILIREQWKKRETKI